MKLTTQQLHEVRAQLRRMNPELHMGFIDQPYNDNDDVRVWVIGWGCVRLDASEYGRVLAAAMRVVA